MVNKDPDQRRFEDAQDAAKEYDRLIFQDDKGKLFTSPEIFNFPNVFFRNNRNSRASFTVWTVLVLSLQNGTGIEATSIPPKWVAHLRKLLINQNMNRF